MYYKHVCLGRYIVSWLCKLLIRVALGLIGLGLRKQNGGVLVLFTVRRVWDFWR